MCGAVMLYRIPTSNSRSDAFVPSVVLPDMMPEAELVHLSRKVCAPLC